MFASLPVMKVIAGAVVGGLAGLIGGAIGGVIDEYLAPLARLMNARDRLAWARGAARIAARRRSSIRARGTAPRAPCR